MRAEVTKQFNDGRLQIGALDRFALRHFIQQIDIAAL
jgi:hypothetical protein